jgi:hypothetical protein
VLEIAVHRVDAIEAAFTPKRTLLQVLRILLRVRGIDNHRFGQNRALNQIGTPARDGADCRAAGRMTDGSHARKLHRGDEPFEFGGCAIPSDLVEARTFAVAVAALVVTVDVTDRRQRDGNRTINPAKKSGGVQKHYGPPLTAPIEVMQPDSVDSYVAADWFTSRTDKCHRIGMIGEER